MKLEAETLGIDEFKMIDRYSYICKIRTNWVGVEDEFELYWTKTMFDRKDWNDDDLMQEAIQIIGLEYDVVQSGDSYDDPAILRTRLSCFGCDEEIELYETYNESVGQDYENDAISLQGISLEVIEIDNLKEIRKEKLKNISS